MLIYGENEVESGAAVLRDMRAGAEQAVPLGSLEPHIREAITNR